MLTEYFFVHFVVYKILLNLMTRYSLAAKALNFMKCSLLFQACFVRSVVPVGFCLVKAARVFLNSHPTLCTPAFTSVIKCSLPGVVSSQQSLYRVKHVMTSTRAVCSWWVSSFIESQAMTTQCPMQMMYGDSCVHNAFSAHARKAKIIQSHRVQLAV